MVQRMRLEKSSFDRLLQVLGEQGFEMLSPQVNHQDEVVWQPVSDSAQLHQQYREQQSPGRYRLQSHGQSDEKRWFTIAHGAQSLKHLTYQPRQSIVRIIKTENGMVFEPVAPEPGRVAVIGARACDVAALQVQQRVFTEGEYRDEFFTSSRESLFIVAVNCTTAQETCFCASMDCGPKARSGFDLALTELDEIFLIEAGSEAGQQVLDALNLAQASAGEITQADDMIESCAAMQTRSLETTGLPQKLYDSQASSHWKEVAERCLSCANCTMVCPTCFCHAIEETPDMSRTSSERVRVWDSCFNPEHGYIHGKNMRPTTAERYRMWMTHKLASWIDQFGTSGCTGCGRCMTWCPAGIDFVAEATAVMTGSKVVEEKS